MTRIGATACLITASIALTTPAQSFEPWKPYQPPALTCGSYWLGLPLNDGRGCLQVSGNAVETISNDTQAGITFWYPATGRVGVIVDDASGLAGVLGIREHRSPFSTYSSSGILAPDHDHLDLSEAFLTVGRTVQIRAGLLDATFDSLAARAEDFDWITDLEPFANLYALGTVRHGGLGAQIFGVVAGGLSAGAGLEDLGTRSDYVTALGYFDLRQGEDSEAKVTTMVGGLADGPPDNWSVEGFAKTRLGILELLSTATLSSDGTWRASASGRLTLGVVFVAAGAEDGNDEADVTGSIHVGDPNLGPSIGLAGRFEESTAYTIEQIQLHGSILPVENMRLEAILGQTEAWISGQADLGPIQYAAVSAAWHPTDAIQFSASYGGNSLGGWKVTGGAEQRF
jgi:hypothetical protein